MSLDAIKAAIFPATTKYLYFVKDEKTGLHRFSKDYKTHVKNINDYRKVKRAKKRALKKAQKTIKKTAPKIINKEKSVFPSKTKLLFNIKICLSGSLGVEILKGESYAINSNDLKQASQIADDMVSKYKMSENSDDLLVLVKNELRDELTKDKDAILKLKNIMLKNEEVTKDDISNI